MQLEKRIEHLIRTASEHLANDVDLYTCKTVSNQALNCVKDLVGDDHPYTNLLEEAADEGREMGLSTACGVLWAAKLLMEKEAPLTRERKHSAGSWRELSGHLI